MRSYTGLAKKFNTTLMVLMALYHLFYFTRILDHFDLVLDVTQHRAISISCVMILIFIYYPMFKKSYRTTLPWYDIGLIVLTVASLGYVIFFPQIIQRESIFGFASLRTTILCYLAIALMCEASRRVIGLAMAIICIAFIIHTHFANYFPSFLHASGYSPDMFAATQFISVNGIFGVALGVFATVIISFLVFAQFLRISGAGDFFINIAMALVGHISGGPAKAAVIASTLFGTISGSASANAASVGTITIPLMKKMGLSSEFAGGVEAAASTGGLIMPPVMGAVAFIMASFLGVPYLQICIAAIVPALLYYISIYLNIESESRRLQLIGLRKDQVPPLKKTLKEGWYYVIPPIVLIVLLIMDFRAEFAALLTLPLIIALSWIRKETRMGWSKIVEAFQESMLGSITAGIACALAGVLLGSLTMTAVGVKLSSEILILGGGNLFIVLLMTGVAALILGMGMPAVPVYIMTVVVVAPALVTMNVPPMAAHMFLFYYGVLSFITPPVATAAYTAAAIAHANIMKTAVWATRLGIVAAIVPFAFVFNPGMLIIGAPMDIIKDIFMGTIGTVAIVSGVAGYVFRKATWWERGLLVVSGILLYIPEWKFNIGGLIIYLFVLMPVIRAYFIRRRETAEIQSS